MVWRIPLASREGITTPIEEEMKIIPRRSAATTSNPRSKPIPVPIANGMSPLIAAILETFLIRELIPPSLISRPAMNIRKTRPISERSRVVSFGSNTPNTLGPIKIPPKIRAITHGRWSLLKAALKNTPAKITMKNGKSSNMYSSIPR